MHNPRNRERLEIDDGRRRCRGLQVAGRTVRLYLQVIEERSGRGTMMRRLPAVLLPLLAAATCVNAADVEYLRDIKPILKERCFACHGALKQEGSLRLDSGKLILSGGDSGPAVIAGEPGRSLLLERIADPDAATRMPAEGTPLTAEQIERIRAWIARGAVVPEEDRPEADPREHWAFRRPVRPAIPAVRNADWVRNPVDAFTAAEHEARGLVPLPAADKAQLLRRVTFDLTGLPPTREELRAFLADDAPDAYLRVVDRLLDSPQYGERWGRHWMDVWRYSDWYGRRSVPDVLNSYGQIWRWRDWIIRSLNEDKGYDRMVREMLAADELAPADEANLVATGYLVRNFYRWNYNSWMKDNVEHTGKAFLGLTLNCCQCHDHKYDPISQEEYFRFRAFFEPLEIRHDRVPGEPDPGPYPKYSYGAAYKPITSGMVRVFDEKLDAETFMYSGGESRNIIPGRPPVAPGAPAFLGGDRIAIEPIELPPEAWSPGLKPFVQQEEIAKREAALSSARSEFAATRERLEKSESDGEVRRLTVAAAEAKVAAAEVELAAIRARIAADRARFMDGSDDADERCRGAAEAEHRAKVAAARLTLALAEREVAAAESLPETDANRVASVQQATDKRTAAQAALTAAENAASDASIEYTPLSPQYPRKTTGRRAALARWIASAENPLTARVAVNHIWLRHFGRGLVATPANFGRNGAEPTHPELLDWLAVEFVENGWSMKHLHRLIVTSSTYRMQSATHGTEHPNFAIDPDNVYLWRFAPRRLEAEAVRDGILYAAGSLDQTIGGPEIDQSQGLTTTRRSLYFAHHGEQRMALLDLFDAATPAECYQRTSTIRPQQALAMTNAPLTIEQGRLLARRLWESASEPEGFVATAFQQILTRDPTGAEAEASREFLKEQTAFFAERAASGENSDPGARARENLVQALFSHHEFVTLR